MDYTEYLEYSIENLIFEEDDDIEEKVLTFLNSPTEFRSFGEGLSYVIRKVMPAECELSPKEFVRNALHEEQISFNRNTLNNWFEGNRPKMADSSRKNLYKICFALKLDLDGVCELFRKVYLDRPFNLRNPWEYIVYYCIRNGYSYSQAESIWQRMGELKTGMNEGTIYTAQIQQQTELIQDEDELVLYILSHPHNFQISNKTAKEELDKLLDEIQVSEEDERLYKEGKVSLRSKQCGYLIREIAAGFGVVEVGANKSDASIETMLDIITTGFTRGSAEKEAGRSLFKNALIPKEISRNFPQKQTFSQKDPSSEELRKMIILLYSYKFWFRIQYEEVEATEDDYMESLNDLLYRCRFQRLYYGNPFDWLFLFCSRKDCPLDIFRTIMLECRAADD